MIEQAIKNNVLVVRESFLEACREAAHNGAAWSSVDVRPHLIVPSQLPQEFIISSNPCWGQGEDIEESLADKSDTVWKFEEEGCPYFPSGFEIEKMDVLLGQPDMDGKINFFVIEQHKARFVDKDVYRIFTHFGKFSNVQTDDGGGLEVYFFDDCKQCRFYNTESEASAAYERVVEGAMAQDSSFELYFVPPNSDMGSNLMQLQLKEGLFLLRQIQEELPRGAASSSSSVGSAATNGSVNSGGENGEPKLDSERLSELAVQAIQLFDQYKPSTPIALQLKSEPFVQLALKLALHLFDEDGYDSCKLENDHCREWQLVVYKIIDTSCRLQNAFHCHKKPSPIWKLLLTGDKYWKFFMQNLVSTPLPPPAVASTSASSAITDVGASTAVVATTTGTSLDENNKSNEMEIEMSTTKPMNLENSDTTTSTSSASASSSTSSSSSSSSALPENSNSNSNNNYLTLTVGRVVPAGKKRVQTLEFLSHVAMGLDKAKLSERRLVRQFFTKRVVGGTNNNKCLFELMLDSLFQFPWNNILHNHVLTTMRHVFLPQTREEEAREAQDDTNSANYYCYDEQEEDTVLEDQNEFQELKIFVFVDCGLAQKIVQSFADSPVTAANPSSSVKRGNISHITSIANAVLQTKQYESLVNSLEGRLGSSGGAPGQAKQEWTQFVNSTLKEITTIENTIPFEIPFWQRRYCVGLMG
jgi:hypothetical protein